MAILRFAESELCPVVRSGTLTVPKEHASARCHGVRTGQECGAINCQGFRVADLDLQQRTLAADLLQAGAKFVERMAVRGYTQVGTGLWVHGPFPSYDFNAHLADVQSSLFAEAERPDEYGDPHPEKVLGLVFEHERAFNPYLDYVFLANFMKAETSVRTRNQATTARSGVEYLPIGAEV